LSECILPIELPSDVDSRARLLLDTIEKIKGSPVKHKPSERKNIAAGWELKDREKAKDEITLAAQNNLKRFLERDTEKRHWNAVVITGASGSGKTRLCNDLFGWIESELFPGSVSRVLSIFITFLNGEQLTSADSISGVGISTQASIAVGIRVASKLFPILGVCESMTLRSLREGLGDLQLLCELPTVMRACSFYLEAQKNKLPVWVTMALDETHFAEHPEEVGAPQFWPSMMSAIMQYVIPGADRALCVDDNVVLFPIISSTWSSERQKHHWSPGNKIFALLPPLSADSVAYFVRQAGNNYRHIAQLWDNARMRHFLLSCALIPDGLALALETAIAFPNVGHSELTKQICLAFARRFKGGKMVRHQLAELALSGVLVQSLDALVDGQPLSHWLECGFASGDEGQPISVPFPALFNEAGPIVPGISQFTNFGQPFHWQDFEALVPHIIQLRCSSLYRLKENHLATLAEVFGSGIADVVVLRPVMTVVTCSKQWLVRKRGSAEQLKVLNRDVQIDAGLAGMINFGSLGHVFAATDGNVHFDGHLSFVTSDGRSVLVCYQVKHTHITNDQVTHFNWAQVMEWLKKARAFLEGYVADTKLFVMITNKEVRGIPENLPPDFIVVHQGNLGSFFAPCLLASAALAHDDFGL
jgi:GTPase SAR1 family protein